MDRRLPGAADVLASASPGCWRERLDDFDIVHDNQALGYGMLDIARMGFPLVTTIHHPITFDRRIDLEAATTRRKKLSLRRWYGFLRMQGKVARSVGKILTVSESSRRDIVSDFGVDPADLQVIPLGVDEVFRPPTEPRVPGRIVAMASADAPMKGIATLLEAFAKLRTERDVELVLVTKPTPGGRTEQLIDRLGIGEHVTFVNGISDAELVEVMGSAEVACVPSLYEGFSLPTAELMACETPLVVSRAGAIPEVVGADGECADLVTPGDVGELERALAALLDDPERRARMGRPAGAGCWSSSAGTRWPRPRPRRTSEVIALEHADSTTRTGRPPVLTVDFDRLGLAAGRPRARHGLRRRAARLRDVPARRRRDRLRPGRRRALRRSPSCSPRCGRPARCPRAPRPTSSRATRSRCRSPTASSTGSSPPRCSSTSPTTSGDRRAGRACCVPAARSRSPCRAGCPRRSAGRSPTSTTRSRAATSASTPATSCVGKLRRPGWRSTARTTRTGCTRRTGGSSARSASTTTRTRWCKAYHQVLVWDIMRTPAGAAHPCSPSGCSTRSSARAWCSTCDKPETSAP